MPDGFDSSMFPTTVYFYPPGVSADAHGGPTLADATSGAVAFPANVQPDVSVGTQTEVRQSSEGRKVWSVFTPTDPGVGVDWLCTSNGMLLRTIGAASPQSNEGWLWRTECQRVT